jgi:hypothetical protein
MFSDYVNDFYLLKKNAKTASEKLIAKMHLNQLYGYFGRRLQLTQTINIIKSELDLILASRIVKSIIEINKNY